MASNGVYWPPKLCPFIINKRRVRWTLRWGLMWPALKSQTPSFCPLVTFVVCLDGYLLDTTLLLTPSPDPEEDHDSWLPLINGLVFWSPLPTFSYLTSNILKENPRNFGRIRLLCFYIPPIQCSCSCQKFLQRHWSTVSPSICSKENMFLCFVLMLSHSKVCFWRRLTIQWTCGKMAPQSVRASQHLIQPHCVHFVNVYKCN